MKLTLSNKDFNCALKELSKLYKIYAPRVYEKAGTYSDTDLIKYGEVARVEEMAFFKKSDFSAKEVTLPITQILFYFTEEWYKMPDEDNKGIIVFLRSCDLHAVERVDQIYLYNKFEDSYYKRKRDKVKFVVVGCKESFDSCFCVSMGTNKIDKYDIGMKINEANVNLHIKDETLLNYFDGKEEEFQMEFVEENKFKVDVPDNIELKDIIDLPLWREYDKRCVACGKCNFVCPTCTCYSTQDIAYSDNGKNGERRRVWASCHVKGFTDMAGGHRFREKHGDRMRFKVMHKVSDYKKRFGENHMCIGCGRCDDACPEYISFSNCVNKLSKEVKSMGGLKNE